MNLSIYDYSARLILFVLLSVVFITPAAHAEEEATHLIISLLASGATFYFDDSGDDSFP